MGILLGKQERNAFLLIEVLHNAEDLLDDLRRKTHRRFVEKNHLWSRHERSDNCAHLLLASGGITRERTHSFAELRKIGVYEIKVALDGGLAVPPCERAGQQVFLDREVAEAVPAFHDLDTAAPHQLIGREILHL